MDIKKVQALLAAVDRGSLTAAASDLGYTQSGLTHMMNSLEIELGLNLLVRSKSGVRLSPCGGRSCCRRCAVWWRRRSLSARLPRGCTSATVPPCGWAPIPALPAIGYPR